MKFLGVIPARYKSTRLPQKILKDICGHTMIEWVYKRVKKSKLDKVIVATDSKEIEEAVKKFGGEVILTSEEHKNGTSRIGEVSRKFPEYDIIINIQGDEPLIEPEMIDSLIDSFKENSSIEMITLKHQLKNREDIENPNCVKVVTDIYDNALYFSRYPIPYPRENSGVKYFKHIGIYGYKREFLKKYISLEQTPLEREESLEQLRVLENGYKIKVLETPFEIVGVDTIENLEEVRKIIKERGLKIDD